MVVSSEIARVWSPQIVEGDWQVAVPKVIAYFMYDNSTLNKNKVMEVYLQEGVAYMNNKLKSYFSAIVPPVVGWEEQFETLLKTLVLFIGSGGYPQGK